MRRRPPRSTRFPCTALFRSPEISELPVRPGLRQAAKEELKALGFHYVVGRCDAEAAMDMNDDRSGWGIPRNRDIGAACIYRSEEHTSELQSHLNLVCRLLLE